MLIGTGCGGAGRAHGDSPGTPANFKIAGCYVTVHVFDVDRARLRAIVPAGYSLGDYTGRRSGTLVFWVLACDHMGAAPGRKLPVILSLVGVQVRSPVDPLLPEAPATFDHYLLYAHANDGELAHQLSAAGIPAGFVSGMTFRRGHVTVAHVPWQSGPYQLTVQGESTEGTHAHDNSYWHDGPGGTSRLEIRLFRATDRNCGFCRGTHVSLAAGSSLAQLVGQTSLSNPYAAFDHNKIAAGTMSLSDHVHVTFPSHRATGFLGVVGAPLDGDSPGRGVRVTRIVPGAPADGLIRRGDRVVAIDGIAVGSLRALAIRVREMKPRSKVTLTILRNGVRREIAITLGQTPS